MWGILLGAALMHRTALTACLLLALNACATRQPVPPDLASIHPQGVLVPAPSTLVSPAPAVDTWWNLYDDPKLGRLIQDALHDNLDLKAAAARVAQARAVLDARKRARLPTTRVTAGAGEGSTLDDQLAAALDDTPVRTGMRYDAGLDFSWDTDIQGRLGASVRAAHAHAAEVQALADATRIDITVETARAYVDICGYAARVGDARQSLDLLRQSLTLQRRLLDSGAGNRLDVVRTQALADEAAAAIPALQAAHDNAIQELSVLLARPADALPGDATACHVVPRLTAAPPAGDVAALLKRRPDVRAADDHLRASTAGIDLAVSELYPSLSIGAELLSSAPSIGELNARSSMVWRIGPLLSWSFPNLSVARARIAGAKAGQREALAQFDKSILRAIADVQVALGSYQAAETQHNALQHASAQTGEALRLAQRARQLGAVDALDLLDAQRSDVKARLAATASDADVAIAQLGLFRALGGGWQTAPDLEPSMPAPSGPSGSAP